MPGDRPPAVLLTADTVGGVWTYALELARALRRCGATVHLATMGAPLQPQQRLQAAGCDGLVLHESAFRLEWMDTPWADVDRCGRWLLQLERELQPDLVHLNQYAFGALPFRAPTLLVAHSCVLSWWRAVHGAIAPAAWDTYRMRVAAGLAGASLVAAPTWAMLDTLRPNYGVPLRGVMLPNGRTAGAFRPGRKQPVVLAAGRLWDEAKNLAVLDAAAAQLPWPVQVAGSCRHPSGREVRPVHAQALGELAQADLARAMAQAAVYALPARYEPFGLSVLEAALSGCALVLGDIASLREVWDDAALYVSPSDSAGLRATLARLLADPDACARRGEAARARALHYGAQAMGQAYLRAYAGLSPAFAALSASRQEELQCA